jgi:hypothetical protein
MQYIASGFYYHVYRISEVRVRKVPTSLIHKAWRLVWWRMVPLSRLVYEIRDIPRWTREQLEQTRGLVAVFPDTALFGNPSPLAADGSYEQDYAPSLGSDLTVPVDIFSERVRAYAEIQKLLWRYGFSERIWNCTFNCGVVPSTHTVLLIDLNEITRDKAVVHEHITAQKWRKQASHRYLARTHPLLASAAAAIIDAACTHTELDALWGTKI